jgi:hypothetical protein
VQQFNWFGENSRDWGLNEAIFILVLLPTIIKKAGDGFET